MSSSIVWGRRACLCLALALAGASPLAYSQAARGKVDPGRLQKELSRPLAPKADKARSAPVAVRKALASRADEAFRVDAIKFVGNTVFEQSQLLADVAETIGPAVHLADLRDAADRVTARYRDAGYLLAQVVAPKQQGKSGQVVFQVFEGEIGEVVYQGDGATDVIRRYGEKLQARKPLTIQALERYLLLMNDEPGIEAVGVLSPSASKVGSATLTVSASLKSFGGDVSLNNRLTQSIGPWRLEAGVELANAFKAQERFSARAIQGLSGRVSIGTLAWEQAWGSEGFKTSLALGIVHARPASDLSEVSGATSVSLAATYPWLRSRSRNAYVRLGLSALDSKAETTGAMAGTTLFHDHVRASRLGVTLDLADGLGGVNLLDFEYSMGLGGSGARDAEADVPASRQGATNRFRKAVVYVSRLQGLTARTSLLLAINAQGTSHALYSSEQFGAGGELFLRAFDPSELLGDRGYAAKAEWRYSPTDHWDLYAFYDLARVSQVDATTAMPGGNKAASNGAGLRYQQGGISGFVEVAKPLLRNVAAQGKRDARAFAGVKYGF
jgi:hemolysin activation/secretion protein